MNSVPVSDDGLPPAPSANDSDSLLPRRDFLRIAGLGAGAMIGGALPSPFSANAHAASSAPYVRRRSDAGHTVVIGAGIWGSSTALELCKRGERVTVIDIYGPGNSRATSGDETRGIRSSYGDRGANSELWTAWARRAITHWREFDEQYAKEFNTRFFMTTGDLILRTRDESFLENTRAVWTKQGVAFDTLDQDEVRKRWPLINPDGITVGVYEPDAGVARARHATQATAAIAAQMGATFITGRATPGPMTGGRMQYVTLDDGTRISGDAFVFSCGPWFGKVFPELLGKRVRIPLGTACYYGTPPGDERFNFPNMPSWNFPGVTGWPALPVDNRGFRVRGGAAPLPTPPNPIKEKLPEPPRPAPPDPNNQDPDLSVRWVGPDRLEGSRRLLQQRFPLLADAPLLEIRTCHYESSINRNFIIDRIPGAENAWIAGLGQAEGFKFAPIAAQYVAQRVLGDEGDPELAKAFAMPTDSYSPSGTSGAEDDE